MMNIFPKYKILFIVVYFSIVAGCGGGGAGDTGSTSDKGNNSTTSDLVTLSMTSQNTITRGKDIFDTVMKKYQPVIDFYGADTTVFQDLVNTNLSVSADSLTSASAKLYNYDSLTLWEDIEFVVVYEDGTRESLPAADILTITGENSSSWYNNGKKIVSFLVKLKAANEKRVEIAKNLLELSEKIKNIRVLAGAATGLFDLSNNISQLTSLTNCMVNVGKYAGVASAAFGLAQTFGLFGSGPSADEIINMKLDHIIKLIEGIYTHLDYIENKLDYIEEVIVVKANKSINLDLKSIINTVNGRIQELSNVISLENKRATAMEFRNEINGILQNYIDYSMVDYENFVEYQVNYSEDEDYQPHTVQINMPIRGFSGNSGGGRVECILTSFKITNSINLLPFSYEGLEYLKNLIMTRMNINSFIETDESSLNAYNSNTALTYLNNNSIYIAKLRNKINQVYKNVTEELDTIKNNINGTSDGSWTDADRWTVKDNYNDLYSLLSITQLTCVNVGGGSGHYRLPDKFNYTPWFSHRIKGTGDLSDIIPNAIHSVIYFDFPYLPSLTFDSSDPIELVKPSSNSQFLDDAVEIIDAVYKAKTNKLLEFAASLAALEVQLALYLDDEDYETYRDN
jgi:hypothetical protein